MDGFHGKGGHLNHDESDSKGGGGGGGEGAFKMSVFGVVSMNDLQESVESPFTNVSGRPMNDLSKNHETLNKISNEEICGNSFGEKRRQF